MSHRSVAHREIAELHRFATSRRDASAALFPGFDQSQILAQKSAYEEFQLHHLKSVTESYNISLSASHGGAYSK
jgi:hypothetical protein